MNDKAGRPVFAGTVDRVLSEKIAEHAHAGPSPAAKATGAGEPVPHAPEAAPEPCRARCGGGISSRPWHIVAVALLCLAIVVVVGRYLSHRRSAHLHS